jgi:hypothetical protein
LGWEFVPSRPDHTNVLDVEKNVATSLRDMLSHLIPTTCDNENSLKLLRELCSLSASILTRKTERSNDHFAVAFCFIRKILEIHGELVEKETSVKNGQSSREGDSDAAKIVADLMLVVVRVIDAHFGAAQREQQETSSVTVSNELLAGILLFLNQALISCPNALMQLSAKSESIVDVEMLFRRVIDSAVSSLCANDPDTLQTSFTFLTTLVSDRTSLNFLFVLPSAMLWILPGKAHGIVK